MRDYSKVSPLFWTRGTGKELRGDHESQIVALYLMTSPHSNMIGVFHQPKQYIAYETGLTLEGASKGLQRCIDTGFCLYDEDTETVFVIEMAAHQIGETLKSGDLRTKGVHKAYLAIASDSLRQAFFTRYGDDYSLPGKPLGSPLEAPLKGIEDTAKGLASPNNPVPVPVPVPDLVPVVEIPLDDGTEFPVTAALVAEYVKAYPHVDVKAELRKARAWCVSNEARRKTRRGCPKFLNTWLSNAETEAAKKPIDKSHLPGGGRRPL